MLSKLAPLKPLKHRHLFWLLCAIICILLPDTRKSINISDVKRDQILETMATPEV